MGLLDSVLGAVINNASRSDTNAPAAGAAGMGMGAGLGGLLGLAAQNPQLVQIVMSLISNDGPVGGLPGLLATRPLAARLGRNLGCQPSSASRRALESVRPSVHPSPA